jgi:peptide/nickel transport system permease protein
MALVVLLIVSLLVFFMTRLLPGDPIYMLVSSSEASSLTTEELAIIKHKYGLDKPLVEQYFVWVQNLALHADLGVSITTDRPVLQLMRERIPVTLHLGGVAFLIGIPIGVVAGVICAVRRGTWVDTVVTSLANIGVCIPVFWLAILLIYFFGYELHLLPVYGYTSPFDGFWKSTQQSLMPIFCLAVIPVATNCRMTRSSMLEVIRQDYIRTAWSKGLRERIIIFKHALKNSLIPIVSLLGVGVAFVIAGSVLVEQVFAIPGMGRLAINSAFSHDYPVLQGIVVFFCVVVLATNLLVDLCYGWIDPRVRYE